MKMLRKIIDCHSLEISLENVHNAVYFTRVTNLQYTVYSVLNCTVKRIHHRSFLEYVAKTSCFKKNFLREKVYVAQAFYKVAVL